MGELVTLTEDGPLGPAGSQVWVDKSEPEKKPAPAKTPTKKQATKP